MDIITIGIAVLFLWLYLAEKKKNKALQKRLNNTPQISFETNFDQPDDEKEPWERFDFYSSTHYDGAGDYEIQYTDAVGNTSTRKITIKEILADNNDNISVNAFCHARQAQRTFLGVRMRRIVDLTTGEIVPVGELINIARKKYQESPEGIKAAARIQAEEDFGKCYDKIAPLYFIAKADGRMVKKEREIILTAFNALNPGHSHDSDALEDVLRCYDPPTHAQVSKYLKTLSIDVATLKLLEASASDLISLKKNPNEIEIAAVAMIRKALQDKTQAVIE
ncbi:hypothetical protein IHQ56_02650 [Methylobacillus flagellatus]|uniref:hypothetical protein n=1 Tax=Methylobacillus flagellatus TaxID=405 RepID=UPI002853FFE5|nr:hypothetical protein [Methylobacillus flagellatus]MDR5170709.1 hypothetical protein [Methylobacillus flagellatus]